jgi:hypothetical protein
MGQIHLADPIVIGGCDGDMTGLTGKADRGFSADKLWNRTVHALL